MAINKDLVQEKDEAALLAEIRLMESGEKTLSIKLSAKNPDFVFTGTWTGRDILLVQRTIVRAYRQLQMASRAKVQAILSEQKSLTSAKG